MDRKYLVLLIFLVCVSIFSWFYLKDKKNTVSPSISITPTVQPTKVVDEIYPIAQFMERTTKKPFGVYITPKTSPVQPERFQGFHTGVDVEYEDISEDVPVLAVCNGEIVVSKWMAGYGGTVVLKCQDNYFIYGHLKNDSVNKILKVSKGEQLAILGKGKTKETDFERKHLHFGIHKNSMDLRGYVQNQNELTGWLDPLSTNLF